MTNNGGVPSRCWCGKGIVTYVSKTEENPYRRFFRCEIGLKVILKNYDFLLFYVSIDVFVFQFRERKSNIFSSGGTRLCLMRYK